jgi:hypothetical protein
MYKIYIILLKNRPFVAIIKKSINILSLSHLVLNSLAFIGFYNGKDHIF